MNTGYIACLIGLGQLAAECADAGVCRLSQTGHGQDHRWRTELGLGYANGDNLDNVSYTTITPRLAFRPWTSGELRVELPFLSLSGDQGDAQGVSDALMSYEQRVFDRHRTQISVLAGLRLPTGDDNVNPGLSQGYQLGLGTLDVLAGVSCQWRAITLALAYQHVGGENNLAGVHLERGNDCAVSCDVAPQWSAWSPRLGVVAVQRLEESQIDDGSGGRIAVADSDGLQVNLRGGLSWMVHRQISLDVSVAKALLSRDSNVDGLTRSSAISAGISATF